VGTDEEDVVALLVVGEGGAADRILRGWPPLGGTPLRGARPSRWRRGRGHTRVVAGGALAGAHVAMARRGAQAGADPDYESVYFLKACN